LFIRNARPPLRARKSLRGEKEPVRLPETKELQRRFGALLRRP
jgi:hypothetical protein